MAFCRTLFRCAATTLAGLVLTSFTLPSDAHAFQVQGLFQIGPSHIGVAFDDSVNVAQALQLSNYTLTGTPARSIQSLVLQENQQIVYLVTSTPLPQSTSYAVAVSGITGRDGSSLTPGGPTSFTTVSVSVMGIDEVQANVGTLSGQQVSVLGQVFLTASSSGGTPSAYIQDATGRGINVFGNPSAPPLSPVDALGNVALVTGTVATFFTTVELTPYTATLITSGLPHIAPRVLTVQQAASASWEGTYIQTTATLTAEPVASGSNNFTYDAADGGTPFTFRVRNATGIDPNDFDTGNIVTGAGAGSQFQTTFQVQIGNAFDFRMGTGPGDTTPPTLVSASGAAGASTVVLTFSEPVGSGASTPANYSVFPTANPGNPIAVTGASVSGSMVTLTIASALAAGTSYTVQVDNVQDLAGNPIAPSSSVAFTTGTPSGFQVTGAFQFGSRTIGVAFSDEVNPSQAIQSSNYAFSPTLAIQTITLQENGQTAILTLSSGLPASTSYALTLSGITSASGAALASSGPFNLTTAAETITDIATVHANIGTLDGQTVTVIGQVFIPTGSRDGTPSGYIQDGSGRGLNVFGGSVQGAVDALGNVAKVTGTVDLFFSTVEITNYTATALATGQPHLGARVLTVPQANASQWEGTYIETTAELTAIAASGTNNVSYEATADGANITFRVGNGIGIDPADFSVGEVVTGRGAGGSFQSTFQIAIGNTEDFFKPSGDMTPPVLVSAAGEGGVASVTVNFSEAVGAGASTAANYTVFPTATPGSPIAVNSAAVSGATVTLGLAAPLAAATAYTLRVSNVADLAGNVITPNSTFAFSTVGIVTFEVTGVFRFGSRYVGVAFSDTVNAAQAVQSANYSFSPSLTIAAVTLQANGQTAILEVSAPLQASTSYSVVVSGITSHTGAALASGGPFNFQTGSQTIIDIATVHADLGSLDGQTVTVIGQVFIPVGSRGGTPSGYIQDGSGRGLNVFGGSIQPAVNALGNVVRVTGTVELFFTTVELTNYTPTLLAPGQPHLGARVLTVAQANSSQWEGTYIETSATLTSIAPSGASNYNYDATAGGANITFRVGNGLGFNPADFAPGDRVTGRGAGGAFQSTFQVNIGNVVDFFKSAGEIPPGPAAVGAQLRAVGGGAFPPLTLVKNLAGAGERFEFEITGTLGARAVCRIFDLQGRLVKVLFDGALTGTATQTLSWDARDEQFEFVPAGMYVCHLETTDLNGNRDEDRAPIVVAVRLD